MQRFHGRRSLFGLLVLASAALSGGVARSEESAALIKRVGDDIKYLASDELEGRGPATAGLQKAADFIRDRFKEVGVASATEDGSYYRPFKLAIDTKVVEEETTLVLRGPDNKELKLKMAKDFQPLATGGEADVKADVVFAGFGITAPNFKYDDYKDADVAGKVVVIIRREPQQGDEKSVFDGKKTTRNSYIQAKVAAAKKAKAAAIIMVNDPFSTRKSKSDQLTAPNGFGTKSMGVPFAHMTQSVADQLLATSPIKSGDEELKSVAAVSDAIDKTLKPLTQPLEGWTAEIKFDFEKVEAEVSNVLGVIEGSGPHADETIVIGAHYDHLGYGPFGSRKPNERAVHNGADDNATGTAAVMELARRFATASEKPPRRIVFIAFTAEERGLIGSNRYVDNPLFPLEKTVAMLNFDMIGNLGEKGLQVGGVQSGKEFQGIVDKITEESDLKVNVINMIGGSDHAGFYRKRVPVLFCFTGLTDLYHTPQDDFEKINVPGVVKTIDFSEQLVRAVAAMPERPEYVEQKRRRPNRTALAFTGAVPKYDAKADGKGVLVDRVLDDSPAAKAGIEKGDVILKIGDVDTKKFAGFRSSLQKYKAGQTVKVLLRRNDEEKTVELKLTPPPKRN